MSGAPERYVALYDGDCQFCMRWRDRMMARDPRGVVEWLSVHDPSVASRFPGLDREDALREMWVYAPDGSIHKGAEGWRVLLRVLDGLSWVANLYRIPGASFIMDRVYRYIAARRYRLSCRGAACRRPETGDRQASCVGAFLVAIVLASSLTPGCGEGPTDPVADRLAAIADPQAESVVLDLFEAYGPYSVWNSHHNVEYAYRLLLYSGKPEPQAVVHQIHRLDLGPGARSFAQDLEGSAPQVVRVTNEGIEVTRAGVAVTDPTELEFPRAFVRIARFSFLLPWNLLDAESRLQYRGSRTPPTASRVPADECDVVRLTFEEKDPARKDDWHDIYVSRVNHLIDRIHSYRGVDKTYWLSLWTDHRTSGGMRVATHRTTHASDVTGIIGPLEAVIEYSEVRFDAPFGDELWKGMKAEAAPPPPAATPSDVVPVLGGRLDPVDASARPTQEAH